MMIDVVISLTLKASPEEVGQAVLELSDELERKGKANPFKWVKPDMGYMFILNASSGRSLYPVPDLRSHLDGVTEIEIEIKSASSIVRGRAATVNISQSVGKESKLTVYANRENLALIQDRWNILYDEIKRRGWVEGQADPTTVQSLAPTDASKTTNWSRDQKIALASLVFVIFTCIAAWLVVPEVREVVASIVRGAVSTLTPTFVSPTAATP